MTASEARAAAAHAVARGGARWVLAARPATLPAAVVPVLVGTAVGAAGGALRAGPFAAALVAALLIQVATNFANDYSDFHRGADTAERLGPTRVTQSGLLAPAQVRRAIAVTFGLAVVFGLYLVAAGGWPILAIGVLSILAGLAYTGGPWPFGYHGLGDVFVFLFFGVVAVTGSAYLQRDAWTADALAASVPVGLLVTNILVVNNLRDLPTDRVAGKRTLAVRIGARATRRQYAALAALAYLVPVALAATGAQGWLLLPWLTIPLAVPLVGRVLAGAEGRALNDVLRRSGQLHLLFGILWAAGWMLDRA
jgi:1,4-dihydroxy-2-naphthoate octaprenyltransferase